MSDELKVMSIIHEPYLEELNSSYVADSIQDLYDKLLVVSKDINELKKNSIWMILYIGSRGRFLWLILK